MPKINVYLPDALASAVKEAGVPVSAVCQAALSDAVERVGRTRQAIRLLQDPSVPASAFARLAEGLQRRMTPRLIAALAAAGSSPDGGAGASVSSLGLLRGLLDDGENLAVRLLITQEIDVDNLRRLCAATTAEEPLAPAGDTADTLFARMTLPARAACAAALEAVIEFGHNYLGCEHLLIGLAVSDGDAARLLSTQGVRAEALRQALSGVTAGAVHERRASLTRDGAFADLARRVEAIERQLAGNAGT